MAILSDFCLFFQLSYSNGPTSPGVDPLESNHMSTTPVPTQSSSDGDVKTEDGQEINCVVCGDKSSGKHYGQFTCEGKNLAGPLNQISYT